MFCSPYNAAKEKARRDSEWEERQRAMRQHPPVHLTCISEGCACLFLALLALGLVAPSPHEIQQALPIATLNNTRWRIGTGSEVVHLIISLGPGIEQDVPTWVVRATFSPSGDVDEGIVLWHPRAGCRLNKHGTGVYLERKMPYGHVHVDYFVLTFASGRWNRIV